MIVATTVGGWTVSIAIFALIGLAIYGRVSKGRERERAISHGKGPPVVVKKVSGRKQQEAMITRMVAAGYRLQGQSSASTFLGLGATETTLTFIRDR
jgi:hypothetical protein